MVTEYVEPGRLNCGVCLLEVIMEAESSLLLVYRGYPLEHYYIEFHSDYASILIQMHESYRRI